MPVTPDHLSLLINLNAQILNPSACENVDIYHITLVGSDAVTCSPVTVDDVYEVTSGGVKTYVLLGVSDVTDGKEYNVTIDDNVLMIDPTPIYLNGFTVNYFGVSQSPTIQTITAISDYIMEVVFTKDMNLEDLNNEANYQFDKGLTIISVEIISQRVVRLHTSKQTPSEMYTLTIL